MREVTNFLNYCLPFLYALSFGVYLLDFFKDLKKLGHVKRLFLFITLLLHSIYLVLRTLAFDHPPITNVFEIFTVLACCISFSYFVLELVTDIRGTGLFIIILSLLFQIVSSSFISEQSFSPLLKSRLLGFHVFSALLGYSGITISAVYGFLYLRLYSELRQSTFGLVFQRLPNLEILEELSFYAAIIGFIMLSVAMAIGLIWLPLEPSIKFTYTDPKLIGTGLVWLLYGTGIFSKISGKWQGKKVVVFSIAGFLIAICSTIATNFIAKSFHSFNN